jgi:hypothetical protein
MIDDLSFFFHNPYIKEVTEKLKKMIFGSKNLFINYFDLKTLKNTIKT